MIRTSTVTLHTPRIVADARYPGIARVQVQDRRFTLLAQAVADDCPHRWFFEAHGMWVEDIDPEIGTFLGWNPRYLVKGDMTPEGFNEPIRRQPNA